MTENEWVVPLSDGQDVWVIVAPGGEVVDTMYFEGLDRPAHEELRYRVHRAMGTHRVKRFAEELRRTE